MGALRRVSVCWPLRANTHHTSITYPAGPVLLVVDEMVEEPLLRRSLRCSAWHGTPWAWQDLPTFRRPPEPRAYMSPNNLDCFSQVILNPSNLRKEKHVKKNINMLQLESKKNVSPTRPWCSWIPPRAASSSSPRCHRSLEPLRIPQWKPGLGWLAVLILSAATPGLSGDFRVETFMWKPHF